MNEKIKQVIKVMEYELRDTFMRYHRIDDTVQKYYEIYGDSASLDDPIWYARALVDYCRAHAVHDMYEAMYGYSIYELQLPYCKGEEI